MFYDAFWIFSVGVGDFVIGLSQIFSFFSDVLLKEKLILVCLHKNNIFVIVCIFKKKEGKHVFYDINYTKS